MKLPLWRRRQDESLDEELRSHLEMAVRDRVERGETPEAARLAAAREFGNVTRVKEVTREAWGWIWLEQVWHDTQYAWRICRKTPALTAAAVLSITLGIGANTAIFTLLDAVLFKQLPVSEPEQLVLFNDQDRPGDTADYAYPDYLELSTHSDVLAGLAARTVVTNLPIKWNGQSSGILGAFVSSSYFDVLRMPAMYGRTISPTDDSAAGTPVAMLGHELWQRRFGRDPSVIGQTVQIANHAFTIIGIAPASLAGLSVGLPDEMLIPISALRSIWPDWSATDPRSPDFRLIGRLRPGVTSRQAESVLTAALQNHHETTAKTLKWGNPRNRMRYLERAITLAPGSRGIPDDLRRQFSAPLLAMMSLVLLVLAIACANVANLLLARASARHREFELRVALGAGRGRLFRQLLTESALLAGAGGTLGVLLAWWSCQWIVGAWSLGDGRTPLLAIRPDLRVLGFTFALSTLTGLAFGVAPVFHTLRRAAVPSMRAESGTAAEPATSKRLRRGLIVAQVGLAMVLLATAGLFAQTLWNLQRQETGLDRKHVLLFKVWTQAFSDSDPASRNPRHLEMQQRIEAIPGVRAAALSMQGSFRPGAAGTPIRIDDRPPDLSEPPTALATFVTARYFETLGMPLLRGRTWSPEDDAKPPAVKPVVINQTAARLLFGDGEPLGRRVRWNAVAFEVVGIVQDARYLDLRETQPALFGLSSAYGAIMAQSIYVRTNVEPSAVIADVRRLLDGYGIVVNHVRTLEQYTEESTAKERVVAGLAGVLGAMAAFLTAVGLCGVIMYAVTRRTHEIGVRIALGAGRSRILRLVMGEVFGPVSAGLFVGLLTALAVTRLAGSLLYGIAPTDATTLAGAAIVMCAVAALAGYLPAKRALSNDPISALRCD